MMQDKYFDCHVRKQVASFANCTCNLKRILHKGAHLSRKIEINLTPKSLFSESHSVCNTGSKHPHHERYDFHDLSMASTA